MAKDTILRSAETTDLSDVPHPADYDEELANARLVEAGLGSDVPSTDLDHVERQGERPIAKTTGNVIPDPSGGEGDLQATLGETVTGDPDSPDAQDDSEVPDGYETDDNDIDRAAEGMDEAMDDSTIDRSLAVQGRDEEE